jgi:hypothetical protein
MPSTDWQHPFTELLDQDFKLWCAGDHAPMAADLAGLEQRLGRALPAQYHRFQTRYGGVMLEVKENAWPRPKLYQVGPFWTFQYAFIVFGMGKEIPDWMNIEVVTAELHRDFPESGELVPFFRQISTTKFYLCFGPDQRIYDWSSEEPAERRALEETFDQIIVRETKALAENKRKIKEQGLTMG